VSFLLDTNVISDLRRARHADVRLLDWFAAQSPDELYLSVITIGEIRQGAEELRRRDVAQADRLTRWLDELVRFYDDRLLPLTATVADEWGRLRAIRSVPVIDAFLAATCRIHGLTLVTRNIRDFAGLRVSVLDPRLSL
jgi:predicted nucleic acid-binding protein